MHPVSGTEASVLLRCLSCAQRGLNSVCEVSESCSVMSLFSTPWTIHTACGILQARILEWVAFPFFKGSSQPRDRTRLPHCRWILFPAESQGKPKNTGVGSLSLLQQIFLTQESNRVFLHCRQILYQQSYQGSP